MSWDMGILSTFLSTPSFKICSCLTSAVLARPLPCEEQPGSRPSSWPWLTGEDLAAGWHGLLWLKPPGDLIVPYNCQRLDMWLRSAGVERFYLDQVCWRLPLTPLPGSPLFSKEMDSHTMTREGLSHLDSTLSSHTYWSRRRPQGKVNAEQKYKDLSMWWRQPYWL